MMRKSSLGLVLILLFCAFCILANAAEPVYVDGTGDTTGAFLTLKDAVASLPEEGGSIIVCGDTTIGTSSNTEVWAARTGKVKITAVNDAVLKMGYGLRIGCDTEFDDVHIVNTSSSLGYIGGMGYELTIGENVTTSTETSRWITIYGGNNDSKTTSYDTRLIIKGGTWWHIFGGHKGTFNGDSYVELSNVTVKKTISAKNETGKGTFKGTGTLVFDLRGGKTVSAATYAEMPTCLTDSGYTATLVDGVYTQVLAAVGPVYVDGTGVTEGAYERLEEAVGMLPNEGGTVIVCGDTDVVNSSNASAAVVLPVKSGKVVIKGENGAALYIAYGLKLNSEVEFDDIALINTSGSMGFISAQGNKLTIGENVTTDITNTKDRWLTIWGGDDSTATTSYNTHLVIKAGKWRYIIGGHKGAFNGNSKVEVSNVVVTNSLTAKNESNKGSFNGTATLIIDLRGNKTVTATFGNDNPTFLTDTGYTVLQEGNTYSQVLAASGTVYVDGTGETDGAYTTLEEAVSVLPNDGGEIVICGDTVVATEDASVLLATKSGKVTITAENGAKLYIDYGLRLGSETEFDNIELVNISATHGYIAARGNKLTIGEGVVTSVDGTDRYLTLWGGEQSTAASTYDAHLVVQSGTWRHIFGGSKGDFGGSATVEVSDVTVTGTLSAKNESGIFRGIGTLIADLRGGKTVTANTFAEKPTCVVDVNHVAVLEETTYMQLAALTGPVYVDGTGATGGAYATLAEAMYMLVDAGGTVIVCGDTTVEAGVLPAKSGAITLQSENGAVLTLTGSITLGGDLVLDGVSLEIDDDFDAILVSDGKMLTVTEDAVIGGELTVEIGRNGTAVIENDAVVPRAQLLYELVVNGNTYTVQREAPRALAYISNASGNDNNDGLTAATAKANIGQADGKGVRNLLNGGGMLVASGNLTISSNYTWNFDGAVTVTGAYGGTDHKNEGANTGIFKLLGKTITVNSDLAFDDVLFLADGENSKLLVAGATLMITETVDMLSDSLIVEVGRNGTAVIDVDGVSVRAASGYELVVNGNTYTSKKIPVTGFISNASGSDSKDGLTAATAKAHLGSVDGNGVLNLLYGGGTLVASGNFTIDSAYTWDFDGPVTITGVHGNDDYKDEAANTGIFKFNNSRVMTIMSDLTFDDILFSASTDAVFRVTNGATLTFTDSVQFLNGNLSVVVDAGSSALIQGGTFAEIRGEGEITVEHCAHTNVQEGVDFADPTCARNGLRYDKCLYCGYYVPVEDPQRPADPDAHDIVWTYTAESASATCTRGCGFSANRVYTAVSEIHVSTKGTIDGNLSAAGPINDFDLAMHIAAAQTGDVTVYVHDYAIAANNGGHSSWNVYKEPAHSNTITISGYDGIGVLRMNPTSAATVLVYLMSGPVTFENMEFTTWGVMGDLYLVANHHKLVLGENLTYDESLADGNKNTTLNIIGGCMKTDFSPENGCPDLGTDVTVLSGSYTNIYAGAWKNAMCCTDTFTYGGRIYKGGDIHLTIGGGVRTREEIIAGSFDNGSLYANVNDVYVDVVGTVSSLRHFVLGSVASSGETYANNVYLRLMNGEILVGDRLSQKGELEYVWGGYSPEETMTTRTKGKLYVYANSESASAMAMYKLVLAELAVRTENNGKWEATVMDETYCDVNKGAHTPGDANEHFAASCTAEGFDTYTCSACTKTYSVKIAKLPHNFGAAETVDATCIAPEMEKAVCTDCGTPKYTVVGSVFAAHSDPERTGFCQVCNLDLTANCAHIFGEATVISTACGTGAKKICDVCGKVEITMEGEDHKYGAYTMTVAPTATTPGMKVRACRRCGKNDTALVYAKNASDATALAMNTTGTLAGFSVENTKLSKEEKAALNALLQQTQYGSEVKISYKTEGDTIKDVVYMIPVPAEYTEYENIRVAVREDNGRLTYVHFEIEKGYIVFMF